MLTLKSERKTKSRNINGDVPGFPIYFLAGLVRNTLHLLCTFWAFLCVYRLFDAFNEHFKLAQKMTKTVENIGIPTISTVSLIGPSGET